MELVTVDLVPVDNEKNVAKVVLNDPERRNALSQPMVERIVTVFDELESQPEVNAVVLTGAPPAFCAGADLAELEGVSRETLKPIYEGFLRIARSPLPTIAAVNGPAVGAGINLALVCDLRIAGRRARFSARFLGLGLHPGGGNTWLLQQIGGSQLATAMTLFGEVLNGEAAAERGLVWRVVDDEELIPTALKLAEFAASAPPALVQELKKTLRDLPGIDSHADAVEREYQSQAWSVEQPFFAERIAALRQRIQS